MTTSFLICFPDVPVKALTWSSNVTWHPDHALENAFYGKKYNYAQLSTAATTKQVTWDLGSGNSRTIDHFILGGVKVLKGEAQTQAIVAGSNDGSTWTSQLGTTSAFFSKTFDGLDTSTGGEDVIFRQGYNDDIAGTLAAYRYFRLTISGPSSLCTFSKCYFGAALDMGKEPDNYDLEVTTEEDSDTWRYPRGQIIMSKAFRERRKFTIEWDGVTDAKADEFMASILYNPYRNTVWLYADTYLDPLYADRLIYCRVSDEDCSVTKKQKDWNDVVCVFIEEV